MKDNFKILPILATKAKPWILKKHYAHRMPNISFAFGIFESMPDVGANHWSMVGVISYGGFANINLNEIVEGYNTLELNRLIIQENQPRNCASLLVSNSLKLLPKPHIIISYADATMGHIGYIYQATNWLYTGQSGNDHEFERGGKIFHRKSIYERLGTSSVKVAEAEGYKVVPIKGKHRYVFFLGSKKEKKLMYSVVKGKWGFYPYPKGDTDRYDSGKDIKQPTFNSAFRKTKKEEIKNETKPKRLL